VEFEIFVVAGKQLCALGEAGSSLGGVRLKGTGQLSGADLGQFSEKRVSTKPLTRRTQWRGWSGS
jgi:hypothetical protein